MIDKNIAQIMNDYGVMAYDPINAINIFKGMQAYADQELRKVNDFIRDIGKLLGEDNLGFDGISWSAEDFKNAIDQEKRKTAIAFAKWMASKYHTGDTEQLNEWYDMYLQSLTPNKSI